LEDFLNVGSSHFKFNFGERSEKFLASKATVIDVLGAAL